MGKLRLIAIFLGCFLFACNVEEKIDEAFITISGKVTHENEPVSGALVLLVENTKVEDGLSLSNGSVTNASGIYKIIDVKAGKYYVLAVDDANGNFEFDKDSDRLGFYGVDPNNLDLEPDLVTVSDEDIDNVDIISLYTLP